MKSRFYAVTCITNLHMGSGDINFGVVDNEVQRDPVTNLPTMFASGIKGGLRDHFEACADDADSVTEIFGSPLGISRKDDRSASRPGALKFLSGSLLLLPVRAAKGPGAYFLVTTRQILLDWANLYLTVTGKEIAEGLTGSIRKMEGTKAYFGDAASVNEEIRVEQNAYKKGVLQNLDAVLVQALGKVLSEDQRKRVLVLPERVLSDGGIHLPIVARNQLDNGVSKNLWYEEYVPHEALFYFAVLSNHQSAGDKALEKFCQVVEQHPLVQFGGNATVGCGLTKLASY